MKQTSIILIFVAFISCRKPALYYHLPGGVKVPSQLVSDIKNIQSINDNSYEAFGFPVQTGPNQVTYYYTRGLTHTTGQGLYYRKYNIAASMWSDPLLIYDDSINNSISNGGQMDNDSIVLFSLSTHTDIYHSKDIYIHKCGPNNNFSHRTIFNWSGIVKLQAGTFFGPLVKGDVPGEYYNILYQFNNDTGSARHRISCIKTSDYWNTYSEVGVLYDGSAQYGETAAVNLGGGKFLALTRNNIAGTLTPFESTDYGVTWTRRVPSNLYWFNVGNPEIPYIYPHDGVFDIAYQCRDAYMIQISKGNSLANFGNATPVYNDPEIYSYHRGTGGNPSLGYISQLKLSTGRYLMIYSKEYDYNRANIQWTVDDLLTDPGGVPAPPAIETSGIGTTTFRIDITGYSDKDWENVRYLLQDISVHSDFRDFVTCKYRNITVYPSVEMHDIRMTGYFDTYSSLMSGTTYYLRIKACNNAGCSAYTTIVATTL